MTPQDLFAEGLKAVPHGAEDSVYVKILQGRFDSAMPALCNDVDAGGEEEASDRQVDVDDDRRNHECEGSDQEGSGAEDVIDWADALRDALFPDDESEGIEEVDEPPLPPPPKSPTPDVAGEPCGAIVSVPPADALAAFIDAMLAVGGPMVTTHYWGVFSIVPRPPAETVRQFGGWQARCPFHRFHRYSLGLRSSIGRSLVGG